MILLYIETLVKSITGLSLFRSLNVNCSTSYLFVTYLLEDVIAKSCKVLKVG